MRTRMRQLLLGAGLATATVLAPPEATAADDFLVSYSSAKWHGGAVDNNGNGIADFCIMLPKRPGEQVLLLLDTADGVMLGLINPMWQMSDIGGQIDVDVIVPGHWKSTFTAQITDTDTIAVKVGPVFEIIDAVKAGNELFAYHYIGDFETSLSGTRDAMNTVQKCFRDQVEPHLMVDTSPTPPTTPVASFQAGQDAYDGKDYRTAMTIWQQAASEGDAKAMNGLGLIHQSGYGVPKDYQTAMEWFKQAASQGLDKAQYNLARLYDKGQGTAVDFKTAVYWYEKSASQGYHSAQLMMGVKYIRGEGVAENPEAARYWYNLAAQNGNRAAQSNLATLLRKGKGGEKDLVKALYWYRRAAEQGHSWGQLRLADMLSEGSAGPADKVEAYKWYLLALRNGKDQAAKRLAELDGVLSAEDRQQATQQSVNWQEARETPSSSTVIQPVVLAPADAVQSEPKPPVTKKLPDDLFGALEATPEPAAPKPTPIPAPSAQGEMRVDGCYDLTQAMATCQSACNDHSLTEKFLSSQLVRKQGAKAPAQYCLKGCAQAEDEFAQALASVAVLKGSKFYCRMLYEETAQLAKDNPQVAEHGDKSARRTHATGSTAYNEATRLEATPEQLAALARAPYSPAVQALVDQMPAKLEGCYDTTGSAAMDYCRAECVEDARFPGNGTGITHEEALDLCNQGCDAAVDMFKDQAIWLRSRHEDGLAHTFCSGIRYPDIAREEIRNLSLMNGLTKHQAADIVGGMGSYWKGARIAGEK